MYCCWSMAKSMSPAAIASRTSGEGRGGELDRPQLIAATQASSAGAAPVGRVRTLISGLALNAASTRDCASVGLFRSTWTTSTVPPDSPNPSVKPRQRSSSAALPTSWLTQIALRHAGFAHALARAEARLVLGLADVGQQTKFGGDIATGVHRDDRDTRLDGGLDRFAQRVGVGDRDDETVRLRRPRRRRSAATFPPCRRYQGLILDLNAHILGRLIHAVLNHRPERIRGLTVTNDDEAQVARPPSS